MGNTHLDLRDYARLHTIIHCSPNHQDNVMRNLLITTILTQCHVYKGITVFGDPDVLAILKYLKQIYDRMVMYSKNADEITKCQKKASLQYLMFLKNKYGKIKGRECAYVRKQCEYLTKDDTRAPMVKT